MPTQLADTLKRLTLYANQIVDISCLASLSALSFLHLNDNQIVDIQALAGLSRLKILLLDNNHVRDIDPLSGLAELLGLWLNGNEITDLSPLVEDAGLDFGDRVYVCGNPLVLTPGSDASAAIDALTRRGVYVYECSEE